MDVASGFKRKRRQTMNGSLEANPAPNKSVTRSPKLVKLTTTGKRGRRCFWGNTLGRKILKRGAAATNLGKMTRTRATPVTQNPVLPEKSKPLTSECSDPEPKTEDVTPTEATFTRAPIRRGRGRGGGVRGRGRGRGRARGRAIGRPIGKPIGRAIGRARGRGRGRGRGRWRWRGRGAAAPCPVHGHKRTGQPAKNVTNSFDVCSFQESTSKSPVLNHPESPAQVRRADSPETNPLPNDTAEEDFDESTNHSNFNDQSNNVDEDNLNKAARSPIQSNASSPVRSNVGSPIRSNVESPAESREGSPFRSNLGSPIRNNMDSPFLSNKDSPEHSNMSSPVRSNVGSPLQCEDSSLGPDNLNSPLPSDPASPFQSDMKSSERSKPNSPGHCSDSNDNVDKSAKNNVSQLCGETGSSETSSTHKCPSSSPVNEDLATDVRNSPSGHSQTDPVGPEIIPSEDKSPEGTVPTEQSPCTTSPQSVVQEQENAFLSDPALMCAPDVSVSQKENVQGSFVDVEQEQGEKRMGFVTAISSPGVQEQQAVASLAAQNNIQKQTCETLERGVIAEGLATLSHEEQDPKSQDNSCERELDPSEQQQSCLNEESSLSHNTVDNNNNSNSSSSEDEEEQEEKMEEEEEEDEDVHCHPHHNNHHPNASSISEAGMGLAREQNPPSVEEEKQSFTEPTFRASPANTVPPSKECLGVYTPDSSTHSVISSSGGYPSVEMEVPHLGLESPSSLSSVDTNPQQQQQQQQQQQTSNQTFYPSCVAASQALHSSGHHSAASSPASCPSTPGPQAPGTPGQGRPVSSSPIMHPHHHPPVSNAVFVGPSISSSYMSQVSMSSSYMVGVPMVNTALSPSPPHPHHHHHHPHHVHPPHAHHSPHHQPQLQQQPKHASPQVSVSSAAAMQRLTHPSHHPAGGMLQPPFHLQPNYAGYGQTGVVPAGGNQQGSQSTSCSLAKLQQLTNGIMDIAPCTPPPTLTPPQANQTPPPPPNTQRPALPPQGYGKYSPYHHPHHPHHHSGHHQSHPHHPHSGRSHMVQRSSPNVTISPNLVGYQTLSSMGYRMQQPGGPPAAMFAASAASYIATNPAGFIQQAQLPTTAAVQMGMVNMQGQYQEQRPPNAMYATYSYHINGALPPQALNSVMRR